MILWQQSRRPISNEIEIICGDETTINHHYDELSLISYQYLIHGVVNG